MNVLHSMKVMRAVANEPQAWTANIKAEVGFDPLSYLRELEGSGMIRTINGPQGNLGYKWALTPDGRQLLRIKSIAEILSSLK